MYTLKNSSILSVQETRDIVEWAFKEGFEYGLSTDLDESDSWDDFAKKVDNLRIGFSDDP